ncbi:FAD-binding monooxygenase, partial [Agrobacterium arsenijevicii]
ARDARILAEGGGQPLVITRQEIVPPIEDGLIAEEGTPGRGLLFPQPAIIEETASRLLDVLTGPTWRFILDGRRIGKAEGEALAKAEGIDGLVVEAVVPLGQDAADPSVLREKDGVLSAWFDRHGVIAALVRPDHYVFGAAQDTDAARQQLSDLRTRLA